jgi:hypothetical protein
MKFLAGCHFCVDEGCAILNVKRCPNRCSFFKTPEQFATERKYANAKINALPAKKQIHISDRYHAGEMPWRA